MTGRAPKRQPLTPSQIEERNVLIDALSYLSQRANAAAANVIVVGTREQLQADIAAMREQLDSIGRQCEAWQEGQQ